jgi:hypothetical protein
MMLISRGFTKEKEVNIPHILCVYAQTHHLQRQEDRWYLSLLKLLGMLDLCFLKKYMDHTLISRYLSSMGLWGRQSRF